MIQRAQLDQRQRLLQLARDELVGLAWLGVSARMRACEDHRRRVKPQHFLDHLAWMYRGAIKRAMEHLHVLDQAMAIVEEQYREHFVVESGQLAAQIRLHIDRRTELGTAPHLPVNDLACGRKDLIGRCAVIAATRAAYLQRGCRRPWPPACKVRAALDGEHAVTR